MSIYVCLNCFTPLTGGVCPRCGFDSAAYMNDAPSHHLKPMTRLNGRYLAGRALGEGGFGITYSGFDSTLNCRVAIKEYFPAGAVARDPSTGFVSCSDSPSQRMTFETGLEKYINEAQALAKLDDIDSVVRIRDYFRENGTAYIVMDFIDGITLGEYVKRLPATPGFKDAYGLVKPVMTALEKMHARGFIHRDVSPDNIMITPDGRVTLLDFGAVRTVSEGGTATEHPVIKRGFSPNEMYSTYGKMGAWTDVFSVCATIYYLITGMRPDEPADRLENDRIFDALPPDVTARERTALKKGLAVKQTDRYQKMSDCIAGVDRALKGPVSPPPPKPTPVWKKILIIAALTVSAVIIAAIARSSFANRRRTTAGDPATMPRLSETKTIVLQKENYMKSFPDEFCISGSVYGNDKYERSTVGKIIFEDTFDSVPATGSWDISKSSDRSVVAYITVNSNVEDAPNTLHIAADGYIIAPVNCECLFYFWNLVEIDFNGIFLTPYTTSMRSMFCVTKCDYYDLSSFDTSSVTDMEIMFANTDFVEINYGDSFDTSNVINMYAMFSNCAASNIDVSHFNTSKVTNMDKMFCGCENLKQIDISNFSTAALTTAEKMFKDTNCTVTYSGVKFWS